MHWLLAIYLILYPLNNALAGDLIYVLPIDKSLKEGERVMLTVKIPESFRALQTTEQFTKTGISTFIPNSDKKTTEWTELLIVHNLPLGMKTDIKGLIGGMVQEFRETDPKFKLMDQGYADMGSFTAGKFAMKYTPAKNRTQVSVVQYYCGSQECSGVNYSVILKSNEDADALLKKMTEFLETNKIISIRRF
jgi:hypothetical protein